jgi:hypothetical protein
LSNLRSVLVVLGVLLVVKVLGLLLGMALRLLAVDVVEALGLNQLVDLGAGEPGDDLLGKAVLDGLAWITVSSLPTRKKNGGRTAVALVVLPLLHGLEGGAASENLMADVALMAPLVVVHTVAVLAGLV